MTNCAFIFKISLFTLLMVLIICLLVDVNIFLHHGREQTGNGFCDEPLLNITVAGIVFTFAMIGEEMSNLLVYSQKV